LQDKSERKGAWPKAYREKHAKNAFRGIAKRDKRRDVTLTGSPKMCGWGGLVISVRGACLEEGPADKENPRKGNMIKGKTKTCELWVVLGVQWERLK